jgi:hypothetical protein
MMKSTKEITVKRVSDVIVVIFPVGAMLGSLAIRGDGTVLAFRPGDTDPKVMV